MKRGNRRRVTTTIDPRLYRLALLSEVNWCDALETGIRALTGHNNDLARMKEDAERHRDIAAEKARLYNEKLEELRSKRKDQQQKKELYRPQ